MNAPRDTIEKTRDRILRDGVILCVRLNDADLVLPATRAAIAGGLRVIEMTLTTPGALKAIETLVAEGAALVGAGTVLSTEHVRDAARVGARFVLSPVFDPSVVDAAHKRGLLAIPGAATPKEILAARGHGALLVKVFPAGALGGPAFLRAVRGPLPDIPLVPTNGPTAETVADYFAAGAAAVGVGGEVFPPRFRLEDVEEAAARVRRAVDEAR